MTTTWHRVGDRVPDQEPNRVFIGSCIGLRIARIESYQLNSTRPLKYLGSSHSSSLRDVTRASSRTGGNTAHHATATSMNVDLTTEATS